MYMQFDNCVQNDKSDWKNDKSDWTFKGIIWVKQNEV